ncbi:MAG: hypothetical protein R3B70_47765 [Polyangiaceae bacterium]
MAMLFRPENMFSLETRRMPVRTPEESHVVLERGGEEVAEEQHGLF